jgi:glycolate oxidase iron-sulfur subunit
MCLEVCPTYRELKVEMDSPRGRIALMRGLVEHKIDPAPAVLEHLDRCLDCRACETACPATVPYGRILEKTRAMLEPSRPTSPVARWARWLAFRVLLPSRGAQKVLFTVVRIAQRLGLVALGRWLAARGVLPARVSALVAQSIDVPAASFRERSAHAFDAERGVFVFPAKGERRARVALMTGCVADRLFAEVNEATVRVLTENGCEVEVRADERCCGALHVHNGERDEARRLARENVAAFEGAYDAIVSNAAGCGAELRHYDRLLDGDPRARAFSAKVRDVCEFLCEIGFRAPASNGAVVRVAYDEPCHLLHAERISDPPKAILEAVAGANFVPLEEADACCGGAGTYFLKQPALSRQVASRKVAAIVRSGADVVATGNPGCLLQIRGALRAAGSPVRVCHPVELLAAAYGATSGSKSGS